MSEPSTKFKCNYCSRSYELKRNYKNHIISCELFHKIQSQTQDEFTEEAEEIPDAKTMYKYIKELALKCNKLEKEVVALRAFVGKKQQKTIMSCLNAHKIIAKQFTDWYSDFTISSEDLLTVFRDDLILGMKNVLKKYIHTEKSIPISAFTNKPNTLFIYMNNEITNQSEWRIMNADDLSTFIYSLNRMFIIEFTKWQKENKDIIENNEQMKDTEINYMIKINGMRLSNEKKMGEIKKWMYTELAKEVEMYEYV
jgi:hypothetical protein